MEGRPVQREHCSQDADSEPLVGRDDAGRTTSKQALCASDGSKPAGTARTGLALHLHAQGLCALLVHGLQPLRFGQ